VTREGIGHYLGAGAGVIAVLVLLSGSDIPPPPGFAAVVVGAIVAGLAIALLVPRMLRLRDRTGTRRTLLVTLAWGAALGAALPLVLALLTPVGAQVDTPGPADLALAVVLGALLVALATGCLAVLAIWADVARDHPACRLVLVTPFVLLGLPATIVIIARIGQLTAL
jgi:hypothetical protein